jgi:ABC-2 type transport system permease protein
MRKTPINKIIIREFKRIRERKTLFLLEIIFPIVLFFFFAEIYEKEVIRELPVAIYDADNTSLSRKVIQFIESSPTLKITEYCNSLDEIKTQFMKGKIQGAFVLPRNFESEIKSGNNANVIVYKNSTNIIVSNYLLKESASIIKTISGGILLKKIKSTEISEERAMAVLNPISIETASLFNPTYSYENYLMPGLVTVTLQMLIMLAAVIVISSEYTHHTFTNLVKMAEGKAYKILIGKSVPHLLIHFSSIILIVGIIFPLYNITINGAAITLILLMSCFIAASFMMGLLISAIINDQLFATEIAVFINTPAFIFSGFTFPIWGMPFAHKLFAQILPFTHFLNAFLKVYQMGATFNSVTSEFLILFLFVLISTVGTWIALKIKIQKHETVLLAEVR